MRTGSFKNYGWDNSFEIPMLITSDEDSPGTLSPAKQEQGKRSVHEFPTSFQQNRGSQGWTIKKPSVQKKKTKHCPPPLNILEKNLQKMQNIKLQCKDKKSSASSEIKTFKNIEFMGEAERSTVENSGQSLHSSTQFPTQLGSGEFNNYITLGNVAKFHKNSQKNKQLEIDSRILQKNSIKISLFEGDSPNKCLHSNIKMEDYHLSENKQDRAWSPQSPQANLFHSQNLGRVQNEKTKLQSDLKLIKKLMSSAEISRLHNHSTHYHNLSNNYKKEALNHSPKGKEDSKETIDSLCSIKSVPNFLSGKKCTKKYSSIPRVLPLNQVIKLKVLSDSKDEVMASLHILKLLADNQTTTVYLVRQTHTNFLYCLKKCEIKNDPAEFEFLIREGKFGAKLDHPSLLKTYCTLYDKENIYQLMEYMEGSTLFDKNYEQRCNLSRKKSIKFTAAQLKLKSVRLVLGSILDAVAYMHSQGVIHRDIKPSNIFIAHDFTLKIGDFGSCGYLGCREFVGTLDYVTPEVLMRKRYNEKVDVWSIGCIAYQLWTGIPPFYDERRETTIENIIHRQFNRGQIDNPLLLSFLDKLLAKDPRKRVSANEALQHSFLEENIKVID